MEDVYRRTCPVQALASEFLDWALKTCFLRSPLSGRILLSTGLKATRQMPSEDGGSRL